MPYIDVQGLTKTFTVRKKRDGHLLREKSTVCALDHVSFQVEQGELLGYIGPNGAGKSTTVKLLCGILTADDGTVTVGGLIPWQSRKQHAQSIGVVFGQRSQLWWDVPVIELSAAARYLPRSRTKIPKTAMRADRRAGAGRFSAYPAAAAQPGAAHARGAGRQPAAFAQASVPG